jgi:hypothetical protein
MFSLKILYHGGIRTQVFSSWGVCDVHCPTPLGYFVRKHSSQSILINKNIYIFQSLTHVINRSQDAFPKQNWLQLKVIGTKGGLGPGMPDGVFSNQKSRFG